MIEDAMTPRNSPSLGSLAPFLLAGLACALAACNVVQPAQEDPTRYFVLSDAPAQPGRAPGLAGGVRIALRSVRLEGYLKRRDMVVRVGENEVQFRDFRLWAEPLDAGVARILRARLLASPDVSAVYSDPMAPDQERDFDVAIEVRRCEGSLSPSGRYGASFVAVVEISTAGANPHVVAHKVFTGPDAAWDGRDFDRLAGLLSADVAALGQEVLGDLPPKG
jgi:uncharacterized lipoprotein YmbA